MVKKIISIKDLRLRQKSKEVKKIDKKVKGIIKDLKDTLKAQKDPEGIGLAAPQIGKNIRIFVMKKKNNQILTVINPKIIKIGKITEKQTKSFLEGCLSLPHYYGDVKRANFLILEYQDEDGNKKRETFKGLEAQIIQHEIDHLNGILFSDHIIKDKKPFYKYNKGEWEKIEIQEI